MHLHNESLKQVTEAINTRIKTMTLEFEMQLRDMGVLPATMLGELQAVADTKHIYPDMLVKNYFNDPRDANGEVPF